jgi:hypothetical protein
MIRKKHSAACTAIYKANTAPEVLSMHINAMVALLEYVEELEERLGVLETKPDPFAPIGRRGW